MEHALSGKMQDLTPEQQAAVDHINGPLLVIAGPGSGKTRVISRRIAKIVDSGVHPSQILAITFTNKAAREMQSRVELLLPGSRLAISTFHKFCARMLRRRSEWVGLRSNFSIFDKTDQILMVRSVLNELNFDPVHYDPRRIANRISRAKNDMILADEFRRKFEERVGDPVDGVVAQVYPEYQRRLLKSNAVDFDDLLLHVVKLLEDHQELREQLDARWKYILVDEYQDTNSSQYRIVLQLSRIFPNLCVTGDPDQSIYGWRGARVDNILKFEGEFADTQVISLDQNFRSTPQILHAADRLIANNLQRKPRTLRTDNAHGREVELVCFESAEAEADQIAEQIAGRVRSGERKWSDFAIFYRVNALSRQLELAFSRHRVPLQISSGFGFYERAEIKDLLAYLRVIENPDDEPALRRVINKPLRGIGRKSQDVLLKKAITDNISLMEAARQADSIDSLTSRARKAIFLFVDMMNRWSNADSSRVAELLRSVIDHTGYASDWMSAGSDKDQQRLANVRELQSAATQHEEHAGDDRSLAGFLETAALVNDGDNLDSSSGCVTLMTLHAAKGLEYPIVYVVGVEDGLIPHERSVKSNNHLREIEEERRLLFVGMTRAMEELYLTEARRRMISGSSRSTIRSQFLLELKPHIRDLSRTHQDDYHERREQFKEKLRSQQTAGGPVLITAASLLAGKQDEADLPIGFAIGMQVRHPRYGRGVVVNLSGMARRRTVTVEFETGDRTETFIAGKSPLQPIGT
jgi:DNA helicase-2/ATP-dependent DNA helicase PcrA